VRLLIAIAGVTRAAEFTRNQSSGRTNLLVRFTESQLLLAIVKSFHGEPMRVHVQLTAIAGRTLPSPFVPFMANATAPLGSVKEIVLPMAGLPICPLGVTELVTSTLLMKTFATV
jgi:hypothetical protein